MKNVFFILIAIGIVISCSKDDDVTTNVVEITINLSNTLEYNYWVGNYSEDDIVEILSQASHFEISELFRSTSGSSVSYKYKPQSGYVGEDFVEITSEKIIDSISNEIEFKTVKLSFNILE